MEQFRSLLQNSDNSKNQTTTASMRVPKALTTTTTTTTTLYFAYGSNLWLDQMTQRCPTSNYVGIARLNDYRWMINSRGYANIVSTNPTTIPPTISTSNVTTTSSSSAPAENNNHHVYGLVYSLQPTDEAQLDINEGVPYAYTKEYLSVDFWPTSSSSGTNITVVDVVELEAQAQQQQVQQKKEMMLVYVDRIRTVDSRPKKEYVYRMNMAIEDALKMGVPKHYIDGVLRKFIPELDDVGGVDRDVEELATRQAFRFHDE